MPECDTARIRADVLRGESVIRLPALRSKYHAVPIVVDGIRFASKLEATRWSELKLLERMGEIASLERQPRFPLTVANVAIGEYRGDFSYVSKGKRIVEDCKGVRTPLYAWKKKHVEAEYKIVIQEVT